MVIKRVPTHHLLALLTLMLPFSPSVTFAKSAKGALTIDGSSTSYPISEAVAEEFQREHPRVRISVGMSGTGGGFKKLLAGDIHICAASRTISIEESKVAKEKKLDLIELPIAQDGLSIVVNNKSPINSISLAQLKKLWEPQSKIQLWSELDPKWPKEKIKLYGPGPDSGTFDFFTEAVVGKPKASRSDYTASEDDNVLVRGIARDRDALAYFGYSYYHENRRSVKPLAIGVGSKAIMPTLQTIRDGSYPLARPLFIYVSREALNEPLVSTFVDFYLKNSGALAEQVGYSALGIEDQKRTQERWQAWLATSKK